MFPSGFMYCRHWPGLWRISVTGSKSGKRAATSMIVIDARQLDLQLPDENVGDVLVDVANVAIGAEQRNGRRDEKANKGDGHNSQRQ